MARAWFDRSIRPIVTAAMVLASGAALAQTSPAHPGAPQAATPAPLPPGAAPDTPGGAARDGVIKPPSTGEGINLGAPPAGNGQLVIPPPGSPGGNPAVVPK